MTSLSKETPSVTCCVSVCSVGCFGLYSLQLSKGTSLDFHGSWKAWLWMLLHASLDSPRAHTHTHTTHTHTQTLSLSLSVISLSIWKYFLGHRESLRFSMQYVDTYSACCFVWVWNLVTDTEGGKQAEGVMDELKLNSNSSMTPAGSNLGEHYQIL